MEENLEKEQAQRESLRELEPHKPEHPSNLFTEERRKSILGALIGNHFPSTAAALAGIDKRTFESWLRQGRMDIERGLDTDFADFHRKVEQATAVGEQKALTVVNKASERGDLRAAQWLLERRHGKGKWEKTDRMEIGGDAGAPIVVELKWPGQRDALPEPAAALPAPEDDDDVVDAEIVEPENRASG